MKEPRGRANSSPSNPETDPVELVAGVRQPGESSIAVQACNDYLFMGAGRGLARLHRYYLQWVTQSENRPKPLQTSENLPNKGHSEGGDGRFEGEDGTPTVDEKFPRGPSLRSDDDLMPRVDPVIAAARLKAKPPTTCLQSLKVWSSRFA